MINNKTGTSARLPGAELTTSLTIDSDLQPLWIAGCPSMYPSTLLSESSELSEPSDPSAKVLLAGDDSEFLHELPKWWLCHSKPRQEKAVARLLYANRAPFYLPLIERKSLSRGRPRSAHVPMLPGYVFVYGNDQQRRTALETNRLAQILPVADADQLEEDLRVIVKLISQEAPLVPYERLEPGQRVRIKSGPFVGLEGTVVRRENKTFMVVAVRCLQAGALMKVEDYWLEPI